MHSWIMEQKAKQTTIILCSHELKEAYSLCDEFNIIRKGRLVYSTLSTDDDSEQHTHAFTVAVRAVTVDVLERLRGKKKLPEWQAIEQQEELVKLCFATYEQAAPWLAALSSGSYQLASFSDRGDRFDMRQELLKFFDLGEKVA